MTKKRNQVMKRRTNPSVASSSPTKVAEEEKGARLLMINEMKRGGAGTSGAVDHMAPSCTRPRESKEGNGRPKIAKAEKEKAASGKNEGDGGDDQPSIKDLLNGMNGSPTASSASPSSRGSDHERAQ